MLTPMPLSHAIRLGAMWRPQAFRGMVRILPGDILATCALGAALEAVGAIKITGTQSELWQTLQSSDRMWPPFLDVTVRCPHCNYPALSFFEAITHLNDLHEWTRERIADWVEQQEQRLSRESVQAAGEQLPEARIEVAAQ